MGFECKSYFICSIFVLGTYTAIKQRDIKLSEKISKEKDQIDIENMEISKENCEARETLKTSVKEKYLLEGLAPLTVTEILEPSSINNEIYFLGH